MRKSIKIINLFKDENIYNIKHIISVNSEDDLNQFWFFLNNLHNDDQEIIQTFLSQFYSIALSYILKKETYFFEITLEDSESFFYFTIFNKKTSSLFKKYSKRAGLDFIHSNNSISIRLDKVAFKKTMKKIEVKNKKREKELIKSVDSSKILKEKKVYTFLEQDDLEELLAQSEDMVDLIDRCKESGLSEKKYTILRSTVSLFCQTLRYYNKIMPFSLTVTKFSNLLNVNKEKFIDLNQYQLSLIVGFIHNIDYWLHTNFVNGGADLYFMDNSMDADYEMISTMINPIEYKSIEMDLDSIFHF